MYTLHCAESTGSAHIMLPYSLKIDGWCQNGTSVPCFHQYTMQVLCVTHPPVIYGVSICLLYSSCTSRLPQSYNNVQNTCSQHLPSVVSARELPPLAPMRPLAPSPSPPVPERNRMEEEEGGGRRREEERGGGRRKEEEGGEGVCKKAMHQPIRNIMGPSLYTILYPTRDCRKMSGSGWVGVPWVWHSA